MNALIKAISLLHKRASWLNLYAVRCKDKLSLPLVADELESVKAIVVFIENELTCAKNR